LRRFLQKINEFQKINAELEKEGTFAGTRFSASAGD